MEQELDYFKNFGQQIEQRLEKLDNFRQRQQLPYPPRVQRTHATAEAVAAYEAAEAALPAGAEEKPQISVAVVGRLVAVRDMGKSIFGHLEDSTGRLQFYLRKDELGPEHFDIFK